MKKVDINMLSSDECIGIQVNGISHCKKINCKWQGLSACEGKNIIKTGYNQKGYKIGDYGVIPGSRRKKSPVV
jgi:hypothetical protein